MEKMTNLEKRWLDTAKTLEKTIVLPEAGFSDRIVQAGVLCAKERIAKVVLLVSDDNQLDKYNIVENEYLKILNYRTHEMREMLASALYEKRKDKGVDLQGAFKLLESPIYFATMMVELSLVDGMVAGAETSTGDTFKPAFQIIKGKTKDTKISTFFVMIREIDGKEEVYGVSDCAVNIDPTAEDLAEFAIQAEESARRVCCFDTPKVALLSYSTKGSAEGDDAIKVRRAKEILDSKQVPFIYDGEIQLDSAIVPSVARLKCPNSRIQGDANVLIFPNLSSANIGYKIMQRFGNFKAIGPVSQGMRKPINDISRGANVDEIVKTIALTVLQV